MVNLNINKQGVEVDASRNISLLWGRRDNRNLTDTKSAPAFYKIIGRRIRSRPIGYYYLQT